VKDRVASLSPNALRALAVGAVLVYAVAAWLLFVSPKRSDAAQAKDDLAAAEIRLAEAQAAVQRPSARGVKVSDVLRLAKAMPASGDQAGLVLELTRLAERSKVQLHTITPAVATAGAGGATMIPVTLAVEGSFYRITGFLSRVRTLVAVRGGKLRARGRLFAVQSVELAEAVDGGFPKLDGTIVVNAYVYDGPIVPPEVPEATTEETPSTGGQAAGSTD
jgi:Tfp pilus assembly protein PilO